MQTKNSLSTVTENTVIARIYLRGAANELVSTPRGYMHFVSGNCSDARQILTTEEAQAFWDDAAYQIGTRPE